MVEPAGAVAIVGMAGVFPGAASMDALWSNVCAGVDAIADAPANRIDPVFFDADVTSADRFYCRRGGFVDDTTPFDPTAFGIMPVTVEGAEPDQMLALAAASSALDDAGRPHERVAPDRIGVVIGRGGYLNAAGARLDQRVRTAQQLVEALHSLLPDLDPATLRKVKLEFQERLGPDRPEASIGIVPNLAASRIANRLDFQGPAYTVDAACASSLIAVDQAMAELVSGRCDVMVAGGVHHCHDLTIWSVFTQLKALSPTQEIRPFSQKADGILIGEGTGLFVLKRLADAEHDDDRIYAVIRGSGVSSDGRATSLMSPQAHGQVLALRRAWDASGLDPATVGLVEAHGTATPAGDSAELATLREVFGPPDDRPRAGLGSIKSMIGHAMPAAGAAGLAKAALAVFHGVLPPTLHVEDPNADIGATRFRLLTEAEPWVDDGPRRAGVNAFGFGGINAHVVIEEHPSNRNRASATPAPRSAGPVAAVDPEPMAPMVLLAAADAAALLEQLAALPAAAHAHATAATPPSDGQARLAIVDPTPKRLELARKVLERGTAWRGRNDVWFEPDPLVAAGGKVAFLFPGVEPVFEPRVDDIAAHFGLLSGDVPEGTAPLERQSRGILALGRTLAEALDRMAIRPDVVAGHSLGEWTGQIVSKMIPSDYVDDFISRLRPGAIEVSDVVFLALGCGADVAAEIVEGLADATVSHDNCPHQSVICGTPEAIAQAGERVRERKVMAQELPFRSGFHSPLFEPFVGGLAAQFADLVLEPPAVPLWSATTCGPYPDSHDDIADLAVRHLVEPVRFRELVEALHADGVRVFVQVGTGSLGAFVDDTLRDHEYVSVPANVAKHSGLGQLQRVGAALWVEGVAVDFSVLGRPEPLPAASTRPASTIPASGVDPPAAAARAGRPLAMATELVRGLTPLDLGVGTMGNGPLPPASNPLLAELRAALDDASAAARQVTELAGSRPGTVAASARPATTVGAATPASVDGSDGPTRVVGPTRAAGSEPVPAGVADAMSLTVERSLSLAEQPYWADHAFFEQPPGWPESEDTFPLVPMTAILEFLAEVACELVPGHEVVSIEDIRAFKWLAVDPPTTVTIKAVRDPQPAGGGDGTITVRTSIDRHARAVVRLAPSFPAAPEPSLDEIVGDVPVTVDPVGVYTQRHLFHGPAYQGLRSFDHFGTNGARGWLESLPFPGSLLDNAGQLFGYWVACAVDRDRLVLPTSLDRICYFGPHPEPGTRVECIVNITHLDAATARADLELLVEGRLWVRIDGWEDRRFQTDDGMFVMFRNPRLLLAEARAGGWMFIPERWHDSATRDVVMRRYLGKPEREVYETHNPNVQRQLLLGRVAGKDAVRHFRYEAGSEPMFPGEVRIDNDGDGRPVLSGPHAGDLRISLAHTAGAGVAIVGDGVDVGIDIEAVEPRADSFARTSFTPAELELLAVPAVGPDRDRALTRGWAAKEAAAKAAGTGMGGRPKDFEITAVEGDTVRIGERWIATEAIMVPEPTLTGPGADLTHEADHSKEHVVAWTILNH